MGSRLLGCGLPLFSALYCCLAAVVEVFMCLGSPCPANQPHKLEHYTDRTPSPSVLLLYS